MSVPADEPTKIFAEKFWSHTGIHLKAGVVYDIRATGTWLDASIRTGPAGYASTDVSPLKVPFFKLAESRRRVPTANWFALIGALDEDESTQFVIGPGTPAHGFTPPRDGELTCFANDLRSKYDNNSGAIEITVTPRRARG
ncbi:MAG: hypothetical protein HYU37_01205 [Acidobacteria bacterium]|nr:hypothetical protein [Acidobacteriota bacterium]